MPPYSKFRLSGDTGTGDGYRFHPKDRPTADMEKSVESYASLGIKPKLYDGSTSLVNSGAQPMYSNRLQQHSNPISSSYMPNEPISRGYSIDRVLKYSKN